MVYMMFDLDAIKEQRERDRKSDLEFMDFYMKWLKKTPNSIWSKQHANFINSGVLINNEWANGKSKEELLKVIG